MARRDCLNRDLDVEAGYPARFSSLLAYYLVSKSITVPFQTPDIGCDLIDKRDFSSHIMLSDCASVERKC